MKAFAPGHITGFFSASFDEDPLEAGSKGAGIVIEDGLTAEVTPSDQNLIVLNGEEVESEVVERVLDMLDVNARVEIESEIPIGCGFGMSGAGALATGIAANAEFGLEREGDQIVAAAHAAEVKAGTGLGDVVPQSQGGVVTRIEPGAPGLGVFGKIEHDPDIQVGYESFGSLETSRVLGDETAMEKVNAAGEDALDDLIADPSLENLIDVSWKFARETGLPTERVGERVKEVQDSGGKASMAMLGETVFGIGDVELENKTGISEQGARLLD